MPLNTVPNPLELSSYEGIDENFVIFYASRDESGRMWCPVRLDILARAQRLPRHCHAAHGAACCLSEAFFTEPEFGAVCFQIPHIRLYHSFGFDPIAHIRSSSSIHRFASSPCAATRIAGTWKTSSSALSPQPMSAMMVHRG